MMIVTDGGGCDDDSDRWCNNVKQSRDFIVSDMDIVYKMGWLLWLVSVIASLRNFVFTSNVCLRHFKGIFCDSF